MDKDQIEATQNQSKAKNSLMWTTFRTEGWRKAVVRRGMKTVPVSEDLERIITRDDENFDFSHARHDAQPALTPPPAPSTKTPPAAPPVIEPGPPVVTGTVTDEYADWLRDSYAELDGCANEPTVEDLRDRVLLELRDADIQPWKVACADKATALFGGK